MRAKSISTTDMIIVSMFTAIMAVMAQISIPLPIGIPITLQTFGVVLCGKVLGHKKSVIALIIYIFLGVMGVPVFSNFTGGIGILLGKTGGFIIGFPIMAYIIGISNKWNNTIITVLLGIIGLAICHITGVLQFSFITKINITTSILLVSIPYIIKDLISLSVALILGKEISMRLNKLNIFIK